MQIQCLMVNGGFLDDGLRTALLLAACGLIRSGKKRTRFKDENGEGGVYTNGKRKFVSSFLHGREFQATIDCKNETIRCHFLVDDRNVPSDDFLLEHGSWVGTIFPNDANSNSDVDDADWWK